MDDCRCPPGRLTPRGVVPDLALKPEQSSTPRQLYHTRDWLDLCHWFWDKNHNRDYTIIHNIVNWFILLHSKISKKLLGLLSVFVSSHSDFIMSTIMSDLDFSLFSRVTVELSLCQPTLCQPTSYVCRICKSNPIECFYNSELVTGHLLSQNGTNSMRCTQLVAVVFLENYSVRYSKTRKSKFVFSLSWFSKCTSLHIQM